MTQTSHVSRACRFDLIISPPRAAKGFQGPMELWEEEAFGMFDAVLERNIG